MCSALVTEHWPEPVPRDDRVANVGVVVRLYGSSNTHRLMPARAALAIVSGVAPLGGKQRRAEERRNAERFMHDLLLYTPLAADSRKIAHRFLAERARINELVWRPWLLRRSRLTGEEHWHAAHRGGRGCVVVFGHIGPYFAIPVILAQHRLYAHMVTAAHYWQPMRPGYLGLATLQLRREYAEKPLGRRRLIPNDAPPGRLVELLEHGESILIAFDAPGSATTPFLGRSVMLGGGSATLAFRTKALVLPVNAERHGSRSDLRILPPIDPADYPDPRSLRIAIARTFEPLVLAQPEALDLMGPPSPLVSEALVASE